jgi:hypothetical protein
MKFMGQNALVSDFRVGRVLVLQLGLATPPKRERGSHVRRSRVRGLQKANRWDSLQGVLLPEVSACRMGWPHKYSNPPSLKLVKQLALDPTVALTGRRLPSGMVTEDCRDLASSLKPRRKSA